MAQQTPLSMGFSRQGYWNGSPCPSPGDLPNPGIEPTSLTSPVSAGGFFIPSATWAALIYSTTLEIPASLEAQLVKNPPAMWETWVRSWVGKIPWRRERLPTPVFWPGEFQGLYSPWGRKSRTRLINFHFHFHSGNSHPVIEVLLLGN